MSSLNDGLDLMNVVWLVARAGAATSVFLMLGLPLDTWARLAVWLAIGLGVYFVYGARHSRIAALGSRPTAPHDRSV